MLTSRISESGRSAPMRRRASMPLLDAAVERREIDSVFVRAHRPLERSQQRLVVVDHVHLARPCPAQLLGHEHALLLQEREEIGRANPPVPARGAIRR
jgi:hypothetical protein